MEPEQQVVLRSPAPAAAVTDRRCQNPACGRVIPMPRYLLSAKQWRTRKYCTKPCWDRYLQAKQTARRGVGPPGDAPPDPGLGPPGGDVGRGGGAVLEVRNGAL